MSEMVKWLVSISVWIDFTVMKIEANIKYLGFVSELWGTEEGKRAYPMMKAQK